MTDILNLIQRDASGRITIRAANGNRYVANPTIQREETTARASRGEDTPPLSKFKLVTVRKLTNYTPEEIADLLVISQANLEDAALRSNQPVPAPIPPPNGDENLYQYYGIYVDEDIYGRTAPIYVFKAPNPEMKCFITANGFGKEDYSVHIAHSYEKISSADGNYQLKWRILTFDKDGLSTSIRSNYLLDSITLPECFSKNYSIDALNYLGGGCWSAIGISEEDKFKVYGNAPRYDSRYKRLYTNSKQAIIYHSTTPSYSFTWCRGILVLNQRERTFKQTWDKDEYFSSRVIKIDRESNYKMTHSFRPTLEYGDTTYLSLNFEESCAHTATYLGNTNIVISSPFQSPDYGTDVSRYSLSKYQQSSNVIRPRVNSWDLDPLAATSKQNPSHLPCLTASPDMGYFIKLNVGQASGQINHPYETKSSAGKRGKTHFYDYKYWWGYGKVTGVTPYGDFRYWKRNRINDEKIYLGTFFDFGEIRIDGDYPNRILTTWEADPPAAIFSPVGGELSFIVTFLNPPLIGHQGLYYYHLQPAGASVYTLRPDDERSNSLLYEDSGSFFGLAGSFSAGSADPVTNIRSYQGTYTQMIGGTTGQAVPSLNIGTVTIAGNETNSIIASSPTPEQEKFLEENPSVFPNGFSDGLVDMEIKNNNSGYKITYEGAQGAVIDTVSF